MKESEKGFFFRFEMFAEIKEGLEEVLSLTGSSVILRIMGKSCGKRFCRRIMKEVKTREQVLKQLCRVKRKENWGEITFQDTNLEKGSGRIIIRNSFEARALKKPRKNPCCHFLKGFLEGFLSELFGKIVTAIEKKCVAKGDKYCEFIFASSVAFYVKEAICIRDKMIKEMVSKYPKE